MGRILTVVGQAMRWPHARAFARAAAEPRAAQERLLLEILRANAETEYGRNHGFSSIRSLEEYQQRVPVVTYEDLRGAIERMGRGEANVLTAERPLYYCCTAGTTGQPKFTPITPSYREQYQRTVHTFSYHLVRDHPRASAHKILYFVGSNRLGTMPDGTPYGTMSGYNYTALPAYAQKLYAVPYGAFGITDLPLKYYTVARLAVTQRVSVVLAITPTPIISCARTLEREAEALIRDVADGGMQRAQELPLALRADLEPLFIRDRGRARELERLAEAGPLRMPAVWPELSLLCCWIGAAAGLYVPELRSLCPGVPMRDAIYSATEGWCTIPMEDEAPGGALGVLSHVYEFIPEEEYDQADRRVLTLDQLEVGRRYFIFLTTGGGLYRYDLNDVLEVDGFHEAVPRMRFAYKGRHCANLAGEKMSEGHVNQAVERLRREHGIDASFFVAVPREQAGDVGYDLYLEVARPFASDHVATLLDQALGEANWEYRAHREAGDLRPLRVIPLEPGNWQRLRTRLVAGGADDAQLKPPHLTTKPAVIEALEPRVTP